MHALQSNCGKTYVNCFTNFILQNEGTVAGSCPLLQNGQIILGVDEKSLQNVTSGIAAMAIRQAFHSDKTVLKLILQNDSGLGK